MDKSFLKAITKKQKNGSLLAIASTENKDRVGDSLKATDWDFTHFQKNPVLQAGHDYRPQYTIGIAKDLKIDNGVVTFIPQFHNITKLAQEIGKMYNEGYLTAWSVGFIPKEANLETKKNQLLEVSAVAVPANPFALTSIKTFQKELESVEENIIEDIKGWIGKEYDGVVPPEDDVMDNVTDETVEEKIWDETDSSFRHRVKEPSLFEDNSFATIQIKKDKPTISAVIGKLKGETSTTIQSLIFPKDEGWTMEEAQKWVEDHPELKAIGNEDVPNEDETKPEVVKPEETMPMDKPVDNNDDEEKLKVCETTEVDKHKHKVEYNESTGLGKTDMVMEHYHEIENKKIKPAGTPEHMHEIIQDENTENKPEDKPTDNTNVEEKPSNQNEGEIKPKKNFAVKERWNKSLSKSFDIDSVPSESSEFKYQLYTQYLDCKVKDIFTSGVSIPSPLIGSYLNAFKQVLSKYELKDTRCFGWSGSEVPPVSEVIKLNSKESDDFLIEGTQFYTVNGKQMIVKFQPTWDGLSVELASSKSDKNDCKNLQKEVEEYALSNNKLKGEMFALSGEFLTKSEDKFDDVVLNETVKKSVVNTSSQINKKGIDFASRGMIFIGPPGTGKTKTCRVMMNESNATFIWISSKDMQAYGAVNCITLAYKLAREIAPTIILFEDIDTWIKEYTIDALKTELDGLKSNKAVLTLLTSNNPEKLPDTLIDRPGRFHEVLEFALPTKAIRSEMLIKWIGAGMENVDTNNFNKIVEETEGMSGAHIKELVEYAQVMSVEETLGIDSALIKSLEKLRKQRELINTIQMKSLNVKLKEGRVLSTKNIEVINQAIAAQKNSVKVLEKLLEESMPTSTASAKTQKALEKNENSPKGRTEPQKHNEQKTQGQSSVVDQTVLRVLQKIAGQSCYALNKLNQK